MKNGFRESKKDDSVAQLVEHYTFNVVVLGSNPSGITKYVRSTSINFLWDEKFIPLKDGESQRDHKLCA